MSLLLEESACKEGFKNLYNRGVLDFKGVSGQLGLLLTIPIANVKVCLLFNEAQKKKTENMSLGGKKK